MNEYDGELTNLRPDGMKVAQTYENGVANGWQRIYNHQGAPMGEMMIRKSRATGEFRTYDSHGNIVQEGRHDENIAVEAKVNPTPRPEHDDAEPQSEELGIVIREVR